MKGKIMQLIQQNKGIIKVILLLLVGYILTCIVVIRLILPVIEKNYEESCNYPEEMYKMYEDEAIRMIEINDYSKSKFNFRYNYSSNDNSSILFLGDFTNDAYVIVSISNPGSTPEYTIKRNVESVEVALDKAQSYKSTSILALLFMALILYLFVIVAIYFLVKIIESINFIKKN